MGHNSVIAGIFASVILVTAAVLVSFQCTAAYPSEDAVRKERFANPPASARMMPIWHHWSHDADDCRRGLDALERRGFGGFVGNANFDKGYVRSADNMTNFVSLVREARRRGMRVWLYDEPGYPSGTAGGLVTSSHPERVAAGYLISSTNVPAGATVKIAIPPGRFVAAAAWPLKSGLLVVSRRRDVTVEGGDANVSWTAPVGSEEWRLAAWSIGELYEGTHAAVNLSRRIPYINLLSREPTDAFIASTHEKYAEAFGGDLSMFDSFFTDEPSLMSLWMRPQPWSVLPYAVELAGTWREKTGRDLNRDAPVVAFGAADENIRRLRYVFWDSVGRLVSENYMHRLDVWGRTHGTCGGGHLLLEEWTGVQLPIYGDFFRCLRALGNPGVDMLTSIPEKVSPQTARLGGSAGALNGARRVMCEVSDHVQRRETKPPHQVTEDEIAGTLNRLLWGGVNTFTSYYVWDAFSDEQIARINLRLARANTLLSEGTDASDVALLYPADTMKTDYDALPKPWCEVTGQAFHAIAGMQTAVKSLFAGNRAWMFVDADSLGRRDFPWRAIVLAGVDTLPLAAMRHLHDFWKTGGVVIAFGVVPVNSEGDFPSAEVMALSREMFGMLCANGTEAVRTNTAGGVAMLLPESRIGEVAAIVDGCVEPSVSVAEECDAKPIRTAHRRTRDGDVFFVMNDASRPWHGRLRLCGGGRAARWDPQTGENAVFAVDGEGWGEVSMPAYGAMLFTTESCADPRRLANRKAR